MYGNYISNHGNFGSKFTHCRSENIPNNNNQNIFPKNNQSLPINNNQQMSITNLINLLQQLLSNFNNDKISNTENNESTDQSIPTEPVDIAANTTIGDTRINDYSGGGVLDNSEIVDIKGQSYSIEALKSQAEAFNQSDFNPERLNQAIDSMGVVKSWGSGTRAGTTAFENYMSTKFPNGLIL